MKIFKCTVHWADESIVKIYDVYEDQLLLPQLENYNVPIPSDCREGICGVCQVEFLKGKVFDQYGEIKTPEDSPLIKPCVCYPQSDLEIKLLD